MAGAVVVAGTVVVPGTVVVACRVVVPCGVVVPGKVVVAGRVVVAGGGATVVVPCTVVVAAACVVVEAAGSDVGASPGAPAPLSIARSRSSTRNAANIRSRRCASFSFIGVALSRVRCRAGNSRGLGRCGSRRSVSLLTATARPAARKRRLVAQEHVGHRLPPEQCLFIVHRDSPLRGLRPCSGSPIPKQGLGLPRQTTSQPARSWYPDRWCSQSPSSWSQSSHQAP